MKRVFVAAVAVAALFAVQAARAAPVRDCTEADGGRFPQGEFDGDTVAAHRLFAEPVIVYTGGKDAQVRGPVMLRVATDGHVVCADLRFFDIDESPFGVRVPRAEMREVMANWRYKPFEINGKPTEVTVTQEVTLSRVASPPSPMPRGTLYSTWMEVHHGGCFGPCPVWTGKVSGDGTVRFTGETFSDFAGTLTYHIPPGEAAALMEHIRSRDVWNARDFYWYAEYDAELRLLSLHAGEKTKAIFDYVGPQAGMPQGITDTETAIAAVAKVDQWIHMTPQSVEQLKEIGFDFHSQTAADTVVSLIGNKDSSDATIRAMLDAGAAVKGGRRLSHGRVIDRPTAMSAAVEAERPTIVAELKARARH